MKRSYNTQDTEPESSNFNIPSEKEHLLQVTDVNPLDTDDNVQVVKLEIVGGDEEGLTMLNRVNLDPDWKGFYFTRLFLKAIGEPYKGQFEVETDRWCGRQFYASVKHTPSKDGTKLYANINEYNFEKKIEQSYQEPVKSINPAGAIDPKDIVWNE